MMNQQEAKTLLDKYNSGSCTAEEKAMVEAWFLTLTNEGSVPAESKIESASLAVWAMVEPARERIRHPHYWPRIAIAAAVATIIFGAGLFYFTGKDKISNQTGAYTNDIAPGKQGATLTLANGKKIRLSDAANGVLVKEAGVSISKSADGKLVYAISPALSQGASSSQGERNTLYNTLSTAVGETYQLRLPDGSLVWLNAASSLTYSAGLFQNGKRTVKLTGEGYFQVAKDKAHPFVVKTDKQEVEVLGTHFNINSYTDEQAVKTTLVEGSVRVTPLYTLEKTADEKQMNGKSTTLSGLSPSLPGGARSIILKPGQQAVLTNDKLNVRTENTGEATAWKDGDFQFNNEKLSDIIKKMERWYNVKILLTGNLADVAFTGKIARSRSISRVLRMLEKTNSVRFKIEGRRITATEK